MFELIIYNMQIIGIPTYNKSKKYIDFLFQVIFSN